MRLLGREERQAVRSLKRLFLTNDTRAAEQAIGELREIIAGQKLAQRKAYAKRLHDAHSDQGQFDAAVADLSADKQMNKEDVDAIAHSFVGGRLKWPSRKAGIEALRKKFAERSYQEGKMRIVEKYRVG